MQYKNAQFRPNRQSGNMHVKFEVRSTNRYIYLLTFLLTHHHHRQSDEINVVWVQNHCKTTLQYTRR